MGQNFPGGAHGFLFWSPPLLILTQSGFTFPLGSESLCELSKFLQSLLNNFLFLLSESFYFFLVWVLLGEIGLVWRRKSSQIFACWWSCTSPVQLTVAFADNVWLKPSSRMLLEKTWLVALLVSGIHNLNFTSDLINLKNNFVRGGQWLKLKTPPVRMYKAEVYQKLKNWPNLHGFSRIRQKVLKVNLNKIPFWKINNVIQSWKKNTWI